MSSSVNGPTHPSASSVPDNSGGTSASPPQSTDPASPCASERSVLRPSPRPNQSLQTALPSLAGRTLGQYRIMEKIGQGGMGSVFKAFDTMLERSVALKVLVTSVLDDPKQAERFLREARSLARLKHPNLVHVYNVGLENDCYFFAMELVEGETLSAAARRRRQIPAPEFVPYLGQILSALHYVHMQGITHRDIKSGNIMFTGKRAVLMDFGLARDENFSGLTSVGAIVGTPDYMSPECAEGLVAGPPTDVYSIGVVMYEALSGTLPFSGRSALSIIRQHVDMPPPPIDAVLPHIDPMLASIIHKCLAKKPQQRYASCAALAADLLRIQQTPELKTLAEELLHETAQTQPRGATAQSGGSDPFLEDDFDSILDSGATLTSGSAKHTDAASLTATFSNAPARRADLSSAGTLVQSDHTVVLPPTHPAEKKSRQWPAWIYVGFGFFGVFFLVFFLAVLKGEDQKSRQKFSGQAALARKFDGGSEEVRWIEFKADDPDSSQWFHVIERRQPDGTWQRGTVSHEDLKGSTESFDLLHAPTPEAAGK